MWAAAEEWLQEAENCRLKGLVDMEDTALRAAWFAREHPEYSEDEVIRAAVGRREQGQ